MSTVDTKTQTHLRLQIPSPSAQNFGARAMATRLLNTFVLTVLALMPVPAEAQDDDEGVRETRVTLGARLVPSFPGADGMGLRPYVDVSRRRGDELFPFRPPDENPSVVAYNRGAIIFGPVIGLVGERRRDDVGGLDKVAFTVEAGAFVRYSLDSHFYLSAEARQGVNGHKALTGVIRADYVARDGDRWLWSLGPRLTLASGRYAKTYFAVTPREAAATGLPAYRPDGGLFAAGVALGARRQLSRRWGVFGYAKYDRLLGTAADSPIVDRFGSRNQWSGGLAVSYVFGRRQK
ncbi:MipA/OmpV family protein [Sphingobium sp. BYY-5]|uniref:MipA/OmpV family protein n=1 Tax=Sphingobium sp. BYY-5 TaxID=2926400 RepID=UPI001FA79B58|nr:MipA/OmpV family protein [Sphingobium sp. BYY-5]MCI4592561.1 MipA/OmpV family protein [Sphingobium sp. BYY-5]